ncbi:histidine kinase, partial [Streptomyces albidoflavus]
MATADIPTADLPTACPLPHVAEQPAGAVRRGPLSSAAWREYGYVFTSFPLAIAGFVLAVTLFSLGAGLAITVLGFPVLVALLAGARG